MSDVETVPEGRVVVFIQGNSWVAYEAGQPIGPTEGDKKVLDEGENFEIEELGATTTTREGGPWPEIKYDVTRRQVTTYRLTNTGGQLVRQKLETTQRYVSQTPVGRGSN